MRFGSDGHLGVHEWEEFDRFGWNEVADLFKEEIDECSYPTVCGKFGICSKGQKCGCPEPTIQGTTYFKQDSDNSGYHSVYLKVQNAPHAVPQGMKRGELVKILGSSIGSFFGLLFLIGILVLLARKRGNVDDVEEDYSEKKKKLGAPTRFIYEDLKAMKRNLRFLVREDLVKFLKGFYLMTPKLQ
ncbi:hypothetical protein NC651_029267 [Populus alba x Populus x berolinensis]|nr:hypothetical protein NC651_029267 [Populus alba x Populus x berolinensis]